MPFEADVRPRGPFSLRLSARGTVDGRSYRDGVFSTVLAVDGRVERGIAAQRQDGSLRLRAESERGLERLRFVLALDDDHSEFLQPLRRTTSSSGRPPGTCAGLRPLRTATVAHALLRAVAGQLITAQEARRSSGG